MSFDTNLSLAAQLRTEKGKNAARRLRAAGQIPATVYGGGSESVSTTIAKLEFAALLRKHGRNKIFTLSVDGAPTTVKIAELQLDPIRGYIVHADLMRLSMTEKSKFNVSVKLVGESEDVKLNGALLEQVSYSLEIRCLPGDLPSEIEADVTSLKVGDHLSIKDLKVDEKIEILDDPDTVLVTVVMPREEAAAEPAPDATTAEPEVIKKGKGDEKTPA
jgi:large subunit ribosomal protein L25